jgi:CspA family cold shock protein
MFSSLFKYFINQQQRIVRLQIRTLSTDRETGIVKRFSKGFGFIQRDSNGNNIFVHFQSILGSGFKTLEVKKEELRYLYERILF